jgi:membrane fusion protein (multidrug efflux system)
MRPARPGLPPWEELMQEQPTVGTPSPPLHPAVTPPGLRARHDTPTGDGRAPGHTDDAEVTPARGKAGRPRRRWLLLAGAAMVALGAMAWWLHARHYEDTDDAQIDGDIVAVSARVPGTVTAVRVSDNQVVERGDVLVELDPTDLAVAAAQARAAVAQAEAQMATDAPSVSITESTNRAATQSARSDVDSARTDLEASQRELDQADASERLARSQLERATSLLAGSSISQAEYDQRATGHEVLLAALQAARQRLEGRRARLAAALSRQQEVLQNAPRQLVSRTAFVAVRQANLALAQAELHQAELNLGYARLTAPADGVIGRKSVNAGERVQPGQQLMALTRTGDVWVTANFRETQVRLMRPGQPVEAHVDALDLDLTGTVESFAGATGSRYSLLPPENASGNYVKVVQRFPVRIRLDPGQRGVDALRPGMSVEPSVKVR